MKKTNLLHSGLSYEIAKLGHTQTLTVADAGLPIPPETKRIDLALCQGVPSLLQTLDVICSEMQVEKITLAKEIQEHSPALVQQILRRFQGVQVVYVSHEEFKEMTACSNAVVRTGETTPYANVLLTSGVTF